MHLSVLPATAESAILHFNLVAEKGGQNIHCSFSSKTFICKISVMMLMSIINFIFSLVGNFRTNNSNIYYYYVVILQVIKYHDLFNRTHECGSFFYHLNKDTTSHKDRLFMIFIS